MLSALVLVLSSCSLNKFSVRKNYHPRIKLEASLAIPISPIEVVNVENYISIKNNPIALNANVENNSKIYPKQKPKKSIRDNSISLGSTPIETMVKILFPKQKERFAPVLHPTKKKLDKVKGTKMDDEQVVGLVVGLIALVLAITSLFMVIGVAHGNFWIFFVVGMILAIISIIMGFVARKTLPFKGISLGAGIVGVFAALMLVIFLLLVAAFGVIF